MARFSPRAHAGTSARANRMTLRDPGAPRKENPDEPLVKILAYTSGTPRRENMERTKWSVQSLVDRTYNTTNMDKMFAASNLIPEKLLDIICILERDEKHHSYKIIRNKNKFSLIVKFGAKNAETTPLKNNAKRTACYQDKKQVSSEDKLCKSKRKRGKKKSSPRASGLQVNIWTRIKILPMSGKRNNRR